MIRKDISRAILIGVLLGVPTVLFFSFIPNYSEPLLVPNMPLEEYRNLSQAAQEAFVRSGDGLRPVAGLEKVKYLLHATPESYLLKLSIIFIPLFLSSLLSAALARKANET